MRKKGFLSIEFDFSLKQKKYQLTVQNTCILLNKGSKLKPDSFQSEKGSFLVKFWQQLHKEQAEQNSLSCVMDW